MKIIQSRILILEELFDFFPFYINQILKMQSINNNPNQPINSDLNEELKDKNDFLDEIGHRINNIFNNLKVKGELNSSHTI